MRVRDLYSVRTIASSSRCCLNPKHSIEFRSNTTPKNAHPNQNNQQELVDHQLSHLIHRALEHRHIDPNQFNQLASICSRQPTQLIHLILGSLLLNDQTQSKYYMNQLDPIHYEDLYPNLFKLCGLIGRGMGMMRRVMRVIQNHQSLILHDHQLSNEQDSRTRLKMIETIEAYIENLIRWSQIHRAWAYLYSFDFGPGIDLLDQLDQIGGPFAKKVQRIKKSSNSFRIWKPNQSAYSSLISIYLILDRPDLALELESQVDLTRMDQPTALMICARALVSRKHQQELHQVTPGSLNPDPLNNLPAILGPITTSVLAKITYQQDGPAGFIKFLSKLDHTNSAPNRLLLSAWLDILATVRGEALMEPVEMGLWIKSIHQEGLLGEPELEKYLRYTREWLEIELSQKIQFINSSQDPSIQPSVFIDSNDPRLGYHQLFKWFQIVYDHRPSSTSSSLQSTDGDPNLDHQFKPSTTVTSELLRILSLTGTSSEKLSELIDKELVENQTPIRSSHMIGLIWSKIVDQDLIGLNHLVEREIKFKYKLVLTGLLTTIILAGLIAIRAPKPIIIKMSQNLIKQVPSSSTSLSSSSSQKNMQAYCLDVQQDGNLQSFLHLIKVAQSIGDFMMVKDLHELIIKKFGRERLVWCDLDGDYVKHLGQDTSVGVGLNYLQLIFEAYNHLNQPLEAHCEVTETLKLWNYFADEKTSLLEEYDHHPSHQVATPTKSLQQKNHHASLDYDMNKFFLSSGALRNYLDFQSITKLFHGQYSQDEGNDGWTKKKQNQKTLDTLTDTNKINEMCTSSNNSKRKREGSHIFLKSLIKSKHQIEKKVEELIKLKKVFEGSEASDARNGDGPRGREKRMQEQLDKEWQVKKKHEVEDRLEKLIEASHLNQLLVDSFKKDAGSLPNSPDSFISQEDHTEVHSNQNLKWRDRSWSEDLKIGLKLIKKLI